MNINQGNRGGEDYLDKALDKVEQMAGKKVRTNTAVNTWLKAEFVNLTANHSPVTL